MAMTEGNLHHLFALRTKIFVPFNSVILSYECRTKKSHASCFAILRCQIDSEAFGRHTEVIITAQEGYEYLEEVSFYNDNPAYLLKNKSGKMLLALKSRDEGADYYILYGP